MFRDDVLIQVLAPHFQIMSSQNISNSAVVRRRRHHETHGRHQSCTHLGETMEMCDESRMESHSRGALVQSAYSLRDVPNVELTLRFYETVENILRHEAVVF
jgi:hypothetical protein